MSQSELKMAGEALPRLWVPRYLGLIAEAPANLTNFLKATTMRRHFQIPIVSPDEIIRA
jgi:hypothetical protein